jgi:hypothetical protein
MSCLRAGHPPWHRKRTVAKREPLDVYEILEISSAVKKTRKITDPPVIYVSACLRQISEAPMKF